MWIFFGNIWSLLHKKFNTGTWVRLNWLDCVLVYKGITLYNGLVFVGLKVHQV